MKVAAAHLSSFGRAGVRRLCVTLFLLFAFTLQAFVTQTHVHGAASDRAPIVATIGHVSTQGVASKGEETIACPFCQAMVVAGAFFTPAPLILSTPASLAEAHALAPFIVGLAAIAAGFSWRSRAPPQR